MQDILFGCFLTTGRFHGSGPPKPPGRSLDSRSGGDAQRRCFVMIGERRDVVVSEWQIFSAKFAVKMHGISIGVLTNSPQLAVFFVVVCEKPAQEQIKISGSLAVYRLF